MRVMQGAPERKNGEDGLPIPPYAVYNIGGGQPENLLDFVNILQEELVRAGVLPKDYDLEAHKELVPMQPGDVPTTYADASALERDFGFTPRVTHVDMLNKVQINYYAAGLHREGSKAVFRYTSLELADRFALLNAAFGEEGYRV